MALRPLLLVLPFAAVVLVVNAACTHEVTKAVPDGDDDDSARNDAGVPLDSGLGVLEFKPPAMYSGFDGTHTFKAPFAIYGSGDDVKVTCSDSSAVDITPETLATPVGPNGTDTGKYYFAVMKKAGDFTLTVKSGGTSQSGTLHVENYDPSRYATGEARYNTGPDAQHPPCTQCHGGASGIDHSPSALVSVTDVKVGLIMSTGLSTGGFPINIDKTTYPDGHKWTDGPGAEQDGLITYLRALEPKGFK
jgi:hypothetical protein